MSFKATYFRANKIGHNFTKQNLILGLRVTYIGDAVILGEVLRMVSKLNFEPKRVLEGIKGGTFEDTVSKLDFESERVLEGMNGGTFEVVMSNLDFESERVLKGIKWGNF